MSSYEPLRLNMACTLKAKLHWTQTGDIPVDFKVTIPGLDFTVRASAMIDRAQFKASPNTAELIAHLGRAAIRDMISNNLGKTVPPCGCYHKPTTPEFPPAPFVPTAQDIEAARALGIAL